MKRSKKKRQMERLTVRWHVLADIPKEKRTPEEAAELVEVARELLGPVSPPTGELRDLMIKHGMMGEETKK